MGKQWEYGMGGIEKFVGFQEMSFGKTLVVSFHILPLVFGDQVCGRGGIPIIFLF